MASTEVTGEFRRGTGVIIAAALGIGLGLSPLPFYTIGVFMPVLSEEFGWRYDQIMVALTVMTLGAFLFAPIAGLLSDKFGAKRTALISTVMFSLVFMSFSLMTDSLIQFYVTWGLLASLGAGTLPVTWTRGVTSFFKKNRGMALGFALVLTGPCGALAKVASAHLIGEIGWRMTYVCVGLAPLLITVPIGLLLFRDAPAKAPSENGPVAAVESGFTLKQAAKTLRFWLLAYAFLVMSIGLSGPVPNLEAIFGEKGFEVPDSVLLASFVGYAVIIGRLSGGWLIDRFWPPGVAIIMLTSPIIGLLALAQIDTPSFFLCAGAVVLMGAALGVEYDFLAFMSAKYFGLRNYSGIYGCLYAFFAVGAAAGPVIGARMFVQTGSYKSALYLWAGSLVIGALALPFLGRREPRFIDPRLAPVFTPQAIGD
ncbi:MAG: MFS transporter [Hyphomonas sp.]|nr:MFS transporter [Hyphomonas sp.]